MKGNRQDMTGFDENESSLAGLSQDLPLSQANLDSGWFSAGESGETMASVWSRIHCTHHDFILLATCIHDD